MAQYYIGLMTGTSLDGIDAALVDLSGAKPLLIASLGAPLAPELRATLLQLQTASSNEIHQAQLAANAHSRACAEVVNALLLQTQLHASDIIAIGNHGQTIRHRPECGYTLQIGNHALLAEYTGICVVGDFRSRDIAAGGQGAPLVPAFHQALFAADDCQRVVVNIGGIANLSWLGRDGFVTGFDSGPGNVLMDSWIQQQQGKNYDADGAWAATGVVIPELLTAMLAEPFFALDAPKSTGRDLFHPQWLAQMLTPCNLMPANAMRPADLSAADVQATLCALTAQSIADAILRQGTPDEVFVCGGGARNGYLMQQLAKRLACPVHSTEQLGVHPDWVEAFAFAWLAERCLAGLPGNLPAVTGASGTRILGAIWPA